MPSRKKKESYRYQKYEHTREYCTQLFNCVECAKNHPTNNCTREENIPAKCVLCSGPHSANYKGCSMYQELQKVKGKPDKNTPVNKSYT